jgi:hypothetical protein
VIQTIESPTPERIEEELRDAGILAHVEKFLPPNWRDAPSDE